MKRWTLKLSLALLAGAVVTWGVALGGTALWLFGGSPTSESSPSWLLVEGEPLQVKEERGRGWCGYMIARDTVRTELYDSTVSAAAQGIIEPPTIIAVPRTLRDRVRFGAPQWYLYVLLPGWPMSSFRCSNVHWPDSMNVYQREETGILKLSVFGRAALLPTEVLPLGFALDTLLYGGVVLGVVEGVGFAWRRRRRRRKGRCAVCGYDRCELAEGAACPECGVAVARA